MMRMNADTELVLTSDLLQSADDTVFQQRNDIGFYFGRGNTKNRYSKCTDYREEGFQIRKILSVILNCLQITNSFELGKRLK